MDLFRAAVTREAKKDAALKSFHLRDRNCIRVFVTKTYNADQDSFTWQIDKLVINGKVRCGPLKSIEVGIDVPMRICVFTQTELRILKEPSFSFT